MNITFRCDSPFWHPLRGNRIGEAANPGPRGKEFCTRLCITNPTCIVNKHDYYSQIVQEHGVDLFTASETAATFRAQQLFNSQMSRSKFKVIWSAPMEDQFSRSDGEQSLRGKASGTAILSSLPCRAAIDTLDPCHRTHRAFGCFVWLSTCSACSGIWPTQHSLQFTTAKLQSFS